MRGINLIVIAFILVVLSLPTSSASLILGNAENFTIFGQSSAGITAATPVGTIITGNIGTSYVGAAIPQISCTEVSGNIYILSTASYSGGHDSNVSCLIVNDTIVSNAASDMLTAFTYYSGVSVPNYAARINELGAGTLTGLDLAPGVYKWTTPVSITGDITLNGTDTTNGTQWIFQVGDDATDTFTVSGDVLLSNGAIPENIVWATKGQATLNSVNFNGTIIGDTGIALDTGTVVNGRILATTLASMTGSASSVYFPLVLDTTIPVITMLGSSPVTLEVGSTYTDAGATALDNIDGNITASIVTVNPVNNAIVGNYTITYNVNDTAGNPAVEVTRTVSVVDTTEPIITLIGSADINIAFGSTYIDDGATAMDNYDGSITSSIVVVNPVDTNIASTYIITYNVVDLNGNVANQVIRNVSVAVAGALSSPRTGGSSGSGASGITPTPVGLLPGAFVSIPLVPGGGLDSTTLAVVIGLLALIGYLYSTSAMASKPISKSRPKPKSTKRK